MVSRTAPATNPEVSDVVTIDPTTKFYVCCRCDNKIYRNANGDFDGCTCWFHHNPVRCHHLGKQDGRCMPSVDESEAPACPRAKRNVFSKAEFAGGEPGPLDVEEYHMWLASDAAVKKK